jgi:hypothetical protein
MSRRPKHDSATRPRTAEAGAQQKRQRLLRSHARRCERGSIRPTSSTFRWLPSITAEPSNGIDTGIQRLNQNADNTINISDLAKMAALSKRERLYVSGITRHRHRASASNSGRDVSRTEWRLPAVPLLCVARSVHRDGRVMHRGQSVSAVSHAPSERAKARELLSVPADHADACLASRCISQVLTERASAR